MGGGRIGGRISAQKSVNLKCGKTPPQGVQFLVIAGRSKCNAKEPGAKKKTDSDLVKFLFLSEMFFLPTHNRKIIANGLAHCQEGTASDLQVTGAIMPNKSFAFY